MVILFPVVLLLLGPKMLWLSPHPVSSTNELCYWPGWCKIFLCFGCDQMSLVVPFMYKDNRKRSGVVKRTDMEYHGIPFHVENYWLQECVDFHLSLPGYSS